MEITLIIFTILMGIIGWFLVDLISQTRNKVNDVDVTVKVISKELAEANINIVKIRSDVDYLKEDAKINKQAHEYESDYIPIKGFKRKN